MFYGRGKNKIADPYTLTDIYKEYIDWVSSKEPYVLTRADFIKVIGDFNSVVVEKLLAGEEFVMPAAMGSIQIYKSDDNRPLTGTSAIDWQTTNRIGKVVHFRNQHSDGYRYKIAWNKRQRNIKNTLKYYFIPCRSLKRALAKIIKARKTDYFQYS